MYGHLSGPSRIGCAPVWLRYSCKTTTCPYKDHLWINTQHSASNYKYLVLVTKPRWDNKPMPVSYHKLQLLSAYCVLYLSLNRQVSMILSMVYGTMVHTYKYVPVDRSNAWVCRLSYSSTPVETPSRTAHDIYNLQYSYGIKKGNNGLVQHHSVEINLLVLVRSTLCSRSRSDFVLGKLWSSWWWRNGWYERLKLGILHGSARIYNLDSSWSNLRS